MPPYFPFSGSPGQGQARPTMPTQATGQMQGGQPQQAPWGATFPGHGGVFPGQGGGIPWMGGHDAAGGQPTAFPGQGQGVSGGFPGQANGGQWPGMMQPHMPSAFPGQGTLPSQQPMQAWGGGQRQTPWNLNRWGGGLLSSQG